MFFHDFRGLARFFHDLDSPGGAFSFSTLKLAIFRENHKYKKVLKIDEKYFWRFFGGFVKKKGAKSDVWALP